MKADDSGEDNRNGGGHGENGAQLLADGGKSSRTGSESSQSGHQGETAEEGTSRWRALVQKSSSALQSSKETIAAKKAATAEAIAAKKAATAEAIAAKKAATAEAITAKKQATSESLAAQKEAATEKLKESKEAAAARLRESKDAAAEKLKTSSSSAAASVTSGFWNVVQLAQKAAEETKKKIPGRAAETISIIHFNDVYNVESREMEPVGGAARFLTAVKSKADLQPLVLFSGDIFAPSIMSTFTKGEQMVPVLNMLGTHCALYGNHDFDFGLETLGDLVEKTTFPWLMSNVVDNETGRPLADGKVSHVVDWCGRRLGLIGLVEREWLDTLATINPEEVDYTDFVDAGSMLASELKRKGCEYVIALTHMRTPNDIRLAESVPEIDLILGGHDHVYEKRKVNGTIILKSGTDFRQFSVVTLDFRQSPVVGVEVEAVSVTKEFQPDQELDLILEEYTDVVEGKMGEVLGEFRCDLDGRFSSVRTAETNLGNLVTDIMVAALGADCALLNSGTLRSDARHPAGKFLLRDLLSILPMLDSLVLLDVSGKMIHQALENGVSQWPRLEGRFPQVSGIRFGFDPSQPPGSRVDPQYVKVGDEYLDLEQRYRLVTKAYLANGKDGYDCLAAAGVLVDEECSPSLTACVQNHFKAIQMRQGKCRRPSVHHQSLVTLSRKTSVVKQLTEDGLIPPTRISPSPRSRSPVAELGKSRSPVRGRLVKQPSVEELELVSCQLEPKVEGRILQLTPEVMKRLRLEKEMDIARLTIQEVEERSSPDSPQEDALRRELFSLPASSSKPPPQNGIAADQTAVTDDLK